MKAILAHFRPLFAAALMMGAAGLAHAQVSLQYAVPGGTLSSDIAIGSANNLSNSGTITNYGTIVNNGTITGSGSQTIGGALTVSGAFTVSGSTALSGSFTVTGSGGFASNFLGTASNSALGYGAGTGAAVTQTTSKSNAVTLNRISGQITLSTASLASATFVVFTLTNSTIQSYDTPIVSILSGGTLGDYAVRVAAVGTGSASIAVKNDGAVTLSESPVIGFNVIKGSSN